MGIKFGRKLKRKNKKGSLQDVIQVGVILLFFGMVVLLGFKIMNGVDEQVQSMDIMDTRSQAASTALTGHYSGVIDNSFLLLAIGLAIATLILAALVRVHPIFIAFFFIGLVLVIFFSGLFSNIYQEMAADPQLAAEAGALTFIPLILNFLPLFVGIFGILLMIVMYKTWDTNV
jgi:H+/Cl- antiporter ClcA|tara:strand:- start:4568 stop:5089 length:522 start_codon:yes stop_codon:yes gene_type:complete